MVQTLRRKHNMWVACEMLEKLNLIDSVCDALRKRSFCKVSLSVYIVSVLCFPSTMTFGLVSVARLLPVDRPNSFF